MSLGQNLPTKPYVNTTSVILQKYQGQPPSIVLHLHPQHFRFDGQDGGFSYASSMRVILECLRSEIIPHEVVEDFRDAGTKFYDGCLIVQIHDHRSASTTSSSKANDNKVIPHSIHNYSESLTPSPFVPFPKEKLVAPERGAAGGQSTVSQGQAVGSDKKDASLASEAKKDKEEKDSKAEKKIRIFTTVLHPTQLTLHADMAVMASTPVPSRLNSYSRPQQSSSTLATPTSASIPVPPTPTGLTINTSPGALSAKTMLNDKTALNFEATTLLATSPALVLTPAKDPEHAQAILRTLRNPHNSFPMPPPKSRKRTTAELAADEAQAVQEERLLLIMDERHSGHTSLAPESAAGDGASVGNGFEP
ncbi:Spt20 family-domain-containing protein, partial [Tuber indicum]